MCVGSRLVSSQTWLSHPGLAPCLASARSGGAQIHVVESFCIPPIRHTKKTALFESALRQAFAADDVTGTNRRWWRYWNTAGALHYAQEAGVPD